MKTFEATETAYKNGYAQGYKDAIKLVTKAIAIVTLLMIAFAFVMEVVI